MLNKKLSFLSLILFSFSAFSEPNYYLKMTSEIQTFAARSQFDDKVKAHVKQQAQLSPAFGVGIGYKFNDLVRADVSFARAITNFNDEFVNFTTTEDGFPVEGIRIIRKMFTETLIQLNGYYNVIDKGDFQVFLGGGVGAARIKEKTLYLTSGNLFLEDRIHNLPINVDNAPSKTYTTATGAFIAGTSIKVLPQVHLEIAYNLRGYGNLKTTKHISHSISTGLRFDL